MAHQKIGRKRQTSDGEAVVTSRGLLKYAPHFTG